MQRCLLTCLVDISVYLLHTLVGRLRHTLGEAPLGQIVPVVNCGYRWVAAGDDRQSADGAR